MLFQRITDQMDYRFWVGLNFLRERIFWGHKTEVIYYVVDDPFWAQANRLEQFRKYLREFRLKLISTKMFCALWNRDRLRKRPVYFGSWRIVHHILAQEVCSFSPRDFDYFMASVTSHQYIGSGLNVSSAIPARSDPDQVFSDAIEILRRFRVITVNSNILYGLLSPHISGLIYAPNGVDSTYFHPRSGYEYDRQNIRIGWVGKIRAAKNYETLLEIQRQLDGEGFEFNIISIPKGSPKNYLLSKSDMRCFYHGIDYYLVVSWHEGTPNPALEAAACGIPVVTTSVGNMPELIEHGVNGFFIEPRVDDVVEQVKNLQDIEPSDYLSLSSNIRERIVADWTWEKNIENYRRAFKKLVKSKE